MRLCHKLQFTLAYFSVTNRTLAKKNLSSERGLNPDLAKSVSDSWSQDPFHTHGLFSVILISRGNHFCDVGKQCSPISDATQSYVLSVVSFFLEGFHGLVIGFSIN